MGEQSTKALRGGKMEDVIFGGTEKRSQVGFAEVTLVLENMDRALGIDADEVAVTRRFYRSGESEYSINKKNVRLKDVNELFMDTGLGRDGYSIIGQGKIDAILSAKSTDRREIFEEAAGISRYRHRKEESERKLQRAEDDLLRVNDKISELELQVEPLRKQSEVAKKYLILRDELRGLEISLWLNELEGIAADLKQLEQDAITAAGVLEKAKQELDELNRVRELCTEKMHSKDVEAEKIRAEISETEAGTASLESETAVLRTQLGHNKENIERINAEISIQEGQNFGLKSQIEERRNRIADIEKENSELALTLLDIEKRSEELAKTEEENQTRIANLLRRSEETALELSNAKAALSSFAASMQEVEDREQTLLSEIQSENDKIDETRKAYEAHSEALHKQNEEAESLKNVLNGYRMRAEGRRKKLSDETEKRNRLEIDFNAVHSRRQMLADMEKEYEGYSRAVKTIMRESARKTARGIHGPAGELLKTEDRFALAVETAMGAAVQNIIVSTEEDGKNAINILKRLDAGRVTFLPISVIRGTRLNNSGLMGEDGFEGIAFDLVSFDEQYRDIYMNLLGRTAIVDNMDSAVRIARKYQHKFRIVTLDGQVINAGGSMTGGSTSKNTGILSRANELKALTQREANMKKSLEEATAGLEKLKREVAAAEYEVQTSADELRQFEDGIVKLTSECEHYKLLLSAYEAHLEQLKNERAGSKSRTETLEKQTDEIKKKISTLSDEDAEIKSSIESENIGLSELSEKRRELLGEEAQIKARRASLEAERGTELSAVNDLDSLRRELSGSREKQEETLRSLEKSSEEIVRSIASHEVSIAEAKSYADTLRAKLKSVNEEKLSLEAEREKSDKAAMTKNERLRDLDRSCERIEQKKQIALKDEKQIADKLWDSYELTRTTAAQQRIELESVQAAKRRTGELHHKISALGTPNLGAIEEFERVNTRYTFLTEQRDDIEKSRTELLGIIGDITSQMKEIFVTEFDRINSSFKETFTELFGGGKCNLELENPEDVLDCGIEIKVQPPGKSLKTITLLSGGEKAFVAIALYYAIIKVKPTPFVIMDEIEAALDDANVIRTSNYMRRLTGKTQFLVITHRRGTMEEADVLFGVTMQEQGVSKVLMMDLDEAEKTISKE